MSGRKRKVMAGEQSFSFEHGDVDQRLRRAHLLTGIACFDVEDVRRTLLVVEQRTKTDKARGIVDGEDLIELFRGIGEIVGDATIETDVGVGRVHANNARVDRRALGQFDRILRTFETREENRLDGFGRKAAVDSHGRLVVDVINDDANGELFVVFG